MRTGRVQVTFDCRDPEALAKFWAAVLGYDVRKVEADTWAYTKDPDGTGPPLFFQRVPESKVVKNRVHLDVRAPAGDEGDRRAQVDAEVDRIVALGGRRDHDVTDEAGYFVVMNDPEGNEFCVD